MKISGPSGEVRVSAAALAVLLAASAAEAQSAPTFTRDVAPLVYTHCATCHRPGEIGPFSLLTYADVRQHARQIAEVTRNRVMPPWKPEPGRGDFLDSRALTAEQIDVFQRWVAAGSPEGDERDLPPVPKWSDGWHFGTPDLIVTMPEAYVLRADGADVFRTFVLPIPTTAPRFVKAMEFRPGNARAVHHANLGIDHTRSSRRLDDQDSEPGHAGSMAQEAAYPPGYLLGWTPGQLPRPSPDGMAWRLERNSDLVAGVHLQPTGKAESIQISVGFYFTNEPPVRAPIGLRLGSETIEIPAGEGAYTITDRYALPVDADILAIQPHAHNLARQMEAQVSLPNNVVIPLISITDWDFRWQDVYRYASPVRLPRGSTISMRYVYDNSAANPRNPSQPPKPVVWGQNTTDEMGDLWIQLVPRNDADFMALATDVDRKARAEDLKAYTKLLSQDPTSATRHDAVGLIYLQSGDGEQAATHFRESIKIDPRVAATHYNLGLALSAQRKLEEASAAFRQAVSLDPQHADAENNLGAMLHVTGHLDEAATHYRRALQLRTDNAEAHDNLGRIMAAQGARAEAVTHFKQALDLRPDWASPMTGLTWLWATSASATADDVAQAVQLGERAAVLTGRADPSVLDALAAAYAAAGQYDRAVTTAELAMQTATTARIPALAAEIQQRLALYQSRKPFRVGS
jgi:Tfp pilus assembly protein PilF/mono/diheme cytochrome c family protein